MRPLGMPLARAIRTSAVLLAALAMPVGVAHARGGHGGGGHGGGHAGGGHGGGGHRGGSAVHAAPSHRAAAPLAGGVARNYVAPRHVAPAVRGGVNRGFGPVNSFNSYGHNSGYGSRGYRPRYGNRWYGYGYPLYRWVYIPGVGWVLVPYRSVGGLPGWY